MFLAALLMSSVFMLVIFRTKIYVSDSVQLLKVLGTFGRDFYMRMKPFKSPEKEKTMKKALNLLIF